MPQVRKMASVALVVFVVLDGLAAAARQPASPDPQLVARGRRVFDQMKCVLCHSLESKGGKLAVALDDIGSKRDAASLRKVLENPQAEFPASKIKMPVFTFAEGEREALVAYLLTLRKSHQ